MFMKRHYLLLTFSNLLSRLSAMNTTTQSNVVGNKAARSCDSCLNKKAMWYCGADDAFLCQSCDTSVHSANQLARRHERVRLEKPPSSSSSSLIWSQGITKKPRTPRSRKRLQKQHEDSNVEVVLVPEFRSEEIFSPNIDQSEEQYSVPILDLFGGEINNGFFENDDHRHMIVGKDSEEEFDLDSLLNDHHEVSTINLFKDVELEDYLGVKIEDDSNKGCLKVEEENHEVVTVGDFYCNSLVGLETGRGESSNWDFEEERVVDLYSNSLGLEMTRQSSNWNFEDYSSSPLGDEEEEEEREKEKRRINLKLNHEAIICAWDRGNSPWMNGIKPDFNLEDDCWPHFMGSGCTNNDEDSNGGNTKSGWPGSGSGSGSGRFDEEREARVLRYKEKRRTRLFAKKIRYEVRKLNAEKRPRMKGRFVKRNAIAASSLPCYMQMNT